MVAQRQVGSEQPHRGQVDRRGGKHLEDHRKPPGGSGDLDAVEGLGLGESERVPAVGEERSVALAQVQIACVQLREMGDDLGCRLALAGGEAFEASDELGVGEATERNERVVLHSCL